MEIFMKFFKDNKLSNGSQSNKEQWSFNRLIFRSILKTCTGTLQKYHYFDIVHYISMSNIALIWSFEQ